MFFAASRHLQNQAKRVTIQGLRTITGTTNNVSSSAVISQQHKWMQYMLLFGAASATTFAIQQSDAKGRNMFGLATAKCAALPKAGGDVVMMGTPTEERNTGILFPALCNGMAFVGCGVRVKYGFVKVYAVGTYMDPIAMSAVKNASNSDIEKALLDPTYPRTIRIVMNRGLSIEKYTAAIVEALEPKMKGVDMDKLEEFKKLNPAVDLVEGAVLEMTIRGHTMLYKNAVGGVGQIDSDTFCKALCEVYYGDGPVSPGHKEEVIKGVKKL